MIYEPIYDESISLGQGRQRKRKYIPGVAAFRFRPPHDWSSQEAIREYLRRSEEHRERIGFLNETLIADCLEAMGALPEESIDLIIADPPFGIDMSKQEQLYARDSTLIEGGYEEVIDDYERFIFHTLQAAFPCLQVHGSFYLVSGWTHLREVLNAVERSSFTLLNHLIWWRNFCPITQKKWVSSHYHLLLLVKHPKKYFFNKVEHYPEGVWQIPKEYRPGVPKNANALPTRLVLKMIDFGTKPGDLVLDPFMGSGTTMVAAKGSWRHVIGFEINDSLAPVLQDAWSDTVFGSLYTPYASRLPTVKELATKYPRAYQHLRELGELGDL